MKNLLYPLILAITISACSSYDAEYISSVYNGKLVLNNEIPMYNRMIKNDRASLETSLKVA